MTTKSTFKSKKDAEDAYVLERNAATVLGCALQDLVNGKVEWVHRSKYFAVGLSRLEGGHGGILILKDQSNVGNSAYVTAHYAEDWTRQLVEHFRRCPPKPSDELDTALFSLTMKIQRLLAENNQRLLEKARSGK